MVELVTTGRAQTGLALRARKAHPADVSIVRRLDNEAFPLTDPDNQRAAPGELERGVDTGEITILEVAGEPAGYVHLDASKKGCLYVRGMGIRPDLQRNRYGSQFADIMLASAGVDTRDKVAVITVTSPHNVPMLRLLFARGFAVRWALPDFFPDGRHRLGFQLRRTLDRPVVADPQVVSLESFSTIAGLVAEGHHVGRALIEEPEGFALELAPAEENEFLPCPSPSAYHHDGHG